MGGERTRFSSVVPPCRDRRVVVVHRHSSASRSFAHTLRTRFNPSCLAPKERRALVGGMRGLCKERLSEALRHPSDSFRESTLITLIRNAGHVCTDVVWSAAGRHDSSAWRVSCDGARSFMVAEDRYGGFVVEPLPYIETIFTILPPVEVER